VTDGAESSDPTIAERSDPTIAVQAKVRDAFGERFVASRVEAEKAAVELLNSRAGDLDPEETVRLGQLFNTHEKAGRVRQDRFSPGFAGATMQKGHAGSGPVQRGGGRSVDRPGRHRPGHARQATLTVLSCPGWLVTAEHVAVPAGS
jgi:hypothetical protein